MKTTNWNGYTVLAKANGQPFFFKGGFTSADAMAQVIRKSEPTVKSVSAIRPYFSAPYLVEVIEAEAL